MITSTVLPKSVKRVQLNDQEIYLLGTAHVSQKSAEEARRVIEEIKPDSVAVELCEKRFEALTSDGRWKEMDIFQVLKSGKAAFVLAQLLMTGFYQRLADKLGVKPGAEQIEAIEAAKEIDATLVLADRPLDITLKRVWRSLSLWEKMKAMTALLGGLFETDDIDAAMIEEIKEGEGLESAMEAFASAFPMVKDKLIDERDRYLAQKIQASPGKKIVAVIGAGHVEGVSKALLQKWELKKLEEIPSPSPYGKIFKWGFPLAIIALIGYSFLSGDAKEGSNSLMVWIASHMILSGIGALVALGHPLTILVSALVSPFTSLNPLIAAGWVGGLTQALLVKPTVADLENLPKAISSAKGFWSNPTTRILLVVVLVNLGSSLASLISGLWIVSSAF
ncbi:MAG: TraB/GumN family protein [Chlamydiia bacterium]|nr:TraB/GumN family protein [Chlamydiia bacterium]